MAGNLNVSTINGAGLVPQNLVMNPEFTINQRVAASRTATTGYNYDRWYYDGTNLLQGIENLNLRNTTYVINWEGSSTCSYSLNTAASSSQGGQSYTSISKGSTITISSLSSNNLWLKFNGDLTGLTKVMLVEGTTVSNFVARLYPNEMALCQRYYETITKDANVGPIAGTYLNGTNYCALWAFKQEKRASPTVALATGASWSSATPSIAPTVSGSFFVASTLFWSGGTVGATFLISSAEL